jgi:hypothetical protein
MFSKPGSVDLNKTLNDLIQAGQRDPNILLKYSQNPPPEFGSQGKLLVSLAASAVARDKSATKTMQPSPTKTIAEQINNKLVESTQRQGIAGLNNQAAPTQAGINSPTAAPAPQSMDGGVASLPVDEGMYNEQNFANGGIISFAKAGRVEAPEDYNYKYGFESYYDQPSAALMEVPTIPSNEDLKTKTLDLKKGFVDPNFYGTQEKTLADQTAEDVAETKKYGQIDLLTKMAEGFNTPGGFLKGAVAAGIKAGPAMSEMNKNILAAKRSNRDAINKLNQAKYAESVGDFKTAMELRQSAEKDAFEAKKTNATLETQIGVARAKNKGDSSANIAKLRRDVDKLAVDDFEKKYGVGSFKTLYSQNPQKYQAEFNALLTKHENYIFKGEKPSIDKETRFDPKAMPGLNGPVTNKIVTGRDGKKYIQVGPNQYKPYTSASAGVGSQDEEEDNG